MANDGIGYALDKAWSLVGEWAPPRGRERTGELRYDGQRLELTTRGFFKRVDEDRIPLIHGLTNEGPATLLDSRHAGFRWSSPAQGLTLRPSTLLLGAHVATRTRYNQLWISIHDFDEWMEEGGIKWDDMQDGGFSSVGLSRWSPKIASIGNRQFSGHTVSPYRLGRTRAEINFCPQITIKYRKAVSFKQLMRDAVVFRELISLLTGTNAVFQNLRARPEGRRRRSEDETVWIVRPARRWTSGLSKGWFIISYADFEKRAKHVLSTWYSGRELDRTALDLYFAARHVEELPLELRYLCTLQALERHHRRYYVGRYMSPAKYKPLEKRMTASLPRSELSEAHAQSLATKLRYGNEKSLRNRLRELVRELPDSFFQKLAWDRQHIHNVLADVRNDLTHYQTNSKREAAQAKLYEAVNAALAIASALFLKRLGFDTESIEHGMSRHHWMTSSGYRFGVHGRPYGDHSKASVWVAAHVDDAAWEAFITKELATFLETPRLERLLVKHMVITTRQGFGQWATKSLVRSQAKPQIIATLNAGQLKLPFRVLLIDQFTYMLPKVPRASSVVLKFIGSFAKTKKRR